MMKFLLSVFAVIVIVGCETKSGISEDIDVLRSRRDNIRGEVTMYENMRDSRVEEVRALTDSVEELNIYIDGKVVFRPDSGNPEYIICGNPEAEEGSLEWKGAIRLLDEMFGSTLNSKGYKVLNPKVGLIYGDGMYFERYERTLKRLQEMGYAASNLVIGVGGILRNHSRDMMGFAIKATYVEVNGTPQEIEKDPVTDPGKKSLKGLLHLYHNGNGTWTTLDCVTPEMEAVGELKTVYRDGVLLVNQTLSEIRNRVIKG